MLSVIQYMCAIILLFTFVAIILQVLSATICLAADLPLFLNKRKLFKNIIEHDQTFINLSCEINSKDLNFELINRSYVR